ncbi:MAG: RHS repeat-associated core domain-containing protein, partial [Verrucomicrobia bacterium]|nr:RHS repeat-associated core domain-containing protein [Verrucomicrobiota bacterium]
MSVEFFQKNNVITESACGNPFLFQGREYEYDTALYYFRARWYEPETGRWLSPDPIGISGGLNLDAFCENDPV